MGVCVCVSVGVGVYQSLSVSFHLRVAFMREVPCGMFLALA